LIYDSPQSLPPSKEEEEEEEEEELLPILDITSFEKKNKHAKEPLKMQSCLARGWDVNIGTVLRGGFK
jgi:hypothetical protein